MPILYSPFFIFNHSVYFVLIKKKKKENQNMHAFNLEVSKHNVTDGKFKLVEDLTDR